MNKDELIEDMKKQLAQQIQLADWEHESWTKREERILFLKKNIADLESL